MFKNFYFLSFILGSILTLCFAPFNLLPAAILSFSGFFYLNIKLQSCKQAFFSGWWFGFGHFITSLHWISSALLAQPEHFAWMIPLALTLIPAVLAIFTGCFTVSVFYFKKSIWLKYCAFSLLWVVFEIIRGSFFIPFPLNNIAYSIAHWDNLLQVSFYLGHYFTSLLIVLTATLLYNITFIRLGLVAVIFLLIQFTGWYVLSNSTSEFEDIKLRIIQPNLAEHHMGRRAYQEEAIKTLISLSIQNLDDQTKAIIWPESGFPYLISEDSAYPKQLSSILPKNSYLITGVDRIDQQGNLYNSIVTINEQGQIITKYDKEILVPFGEYIPLRKFIPMIQKIAYGIGDFTAGVNKKTIYYNEPWLNFAPMICYEVIFPLNTNKQSAKWLLNLTNDAWFGNSLGPFQHFAMAKFKAAEYGLPLVRVANTGISSVVDSYGRILNRIDLNTQGVLDFMLPKTTRHTLGLCFFIKNNTLILIFLLLIICTIAETMLGLSGKFFNK